MPPKIAAHSEAKKIYEDELLRIQEVYNAILAFKNEKGESIIPAEDARMVLPNGCETKIVITMNCRALFNFFAERLCNRAQWEIRQMAGMMLKECKNIAPEVFKYAGPTCVTEKICWQGKMNCGKPAADKSIELRSRG